MQNRASDYAISNALTLRDFEYQLAGWILDGELRQLSARTLAERQFIMGKFRWFLDHRKLQQVGPLEVKAFLAYVGRDHGAGCRWGNEHHTGQVKPATALAYFRTLRGFFNWYVQEHPSFPHPLSNLKPPRVPKDQIQPFTADEVAKLEAAAKASRYRARDEALIQFLLDTGCRAEEVCEVRVEVLDLLGRKCRVTGKGRKERTVYFGKTTTRALMQYLRGMELNGADPLFVSEGGRESGEPFTPNGLGQVLRRLNKKAGITGTRCSPHTFRHTFAIEFLRNGGDIYTLKELLGHSSLTMVMRYLAIAQADMERQHRRCSPADHMKKKRK